MSTLPTFSNSTLSRLLKSALTRTKGQFHPSVLLLEDILNSLLNNHFSYSDKRVMLGALDSFLDLWEALLSSIEIFSAAEKKVTYGILKELIRRPEFHPEYLDMRSKSGIGSILSSVFSASSAAHNVASRYKAMLVRTQSLVFQMLKLPLNAPEAVSFCASVTAMSCVRIYAPTDTTMFLQGLSEPTGCILSTSQSPSPRPQQQPFEGQKDSSAAGIEPETSGSPSDVLTDQPAVPASSAAPIGSAAGGQGLIDLSIAGSLLAETTTLYRQNMTSDAQSATLSRLFVYHTFLCNIQSSDEEHEVLASMRNCALWLDAVKDRTDFFSIFLLEYSAQVHSSVWPPSLPGEEPDDLTFKRFPWSVLPGYTQLIRRFVAHGLSHPSPAHYPPEWEVVSIGLLRNDELIGTFVKMAFGRTSAYDLEGVMRTLDLVDDWFKALESQRAFVPLSFDLDFFFAGIRALFDTEHFQVTIRTLILLYNVVSLFRGSHRISFISHFLVRDYFYRFFLHWSTDVRMVYQRILVYKIIRLKKEESEATKKAKAKRKSDKKSSSLKKSGDAIAENLDSFPDDSILDDAGRRSVEQDGTTRASADFDSLSVLDRDLPERRSLDSSLVRGRASISNDFGARADLTSLSGTGEKKKSGFLGFAKKSSKSSSKTAGQAPLAAEVAPAATVGSAVESTQSSEPGGATTPAPALATDFQSDSEEAVDTVLRSKVDLYVNSLEHPEAIDPSHGIEFPENISHLKVYNERSIKEYQTLLKEYDSWKAYVMSPQCPAIQYPILSIPQFDMCSD